HFFFQAEDGIRDATVTGVQTCALPIFQAPCRLQRADGRRKYFCKSGSSSSSCVAGSGSVTYSSKSALIPVNPLRVTPTMVNGIQIGRASCMERVERWEAAGAVTRKEGM